MAKLREHDVQEDVLAGGHGDVGGFERRLRTLASGQPRLGESCGDGGYARARYKMKCGGSAKVERCGEARLGGERCGEAFARWRAVRHASRHR